MTVGEDFEGDNKKSKPINFKIVLNIILSRYCHSPFKPKAEESRQKQVNERPADIISA